MTPEKLQKLLKTTSRLHILYVEDDPDARSQMIKMLENFFTHIEVASDGKEAFKMYQEYYFETRGFYDLILTDISMPQMNGIELCKQIYSHNDMQSIIVLSAYSETEDLIELINIGVRGFLQKPISLDHLVEALESFCKEYTSFNISTFKAGYTYDKINHIFSYDDKEVFLNPKEAKAMTFLIDNSQGVTQKELFEAVYYDEPLKDYTPDAIKGVLKRLRQKLPKDFIKHNRQKGYHVK